MNATEEKVPVWPERKIYRQPNKLIIASDFRFKYEGKSYSHAIMHKHFRGQSFRAFTETEVQNMIEMFDSETKRIFGHIDLERPLYDNKRLLNHPNTALIDE